VVGLSPKRKVVKAWVEEKRCSVRQACQVVRLGRSSYRYTATKNKLEERLTKRMQVFSRRYPRYGYRRMTAVLQKDGWKVNKKRVQRLMRIVGIQVKQKAKKRRRLGLSTGIRRKAEYPNQVWSWDLIQDQTAEGRMLKCLTIIDEYTREILRIRVDRYLTSGDVFMEL